MKATKESYAPELWPQLNQQDPDNYPLTVDDWRTIKLLEIDRNFHAEFGIHKLTSASLGVTFDNRRFGDLNDKDNVQSLIDLAEEPAYIKDSSGNWHGLTIAQLQALKIEMIIDGHSIYQKLSDLQTQINDPAATITQLEAIKW